MGKRPRISKSDLPNQERILYLKRLEKLFEQYTLLAERYRTAENGREKIGLGEKLNGLRKNCQQQMEQFKLVDIGCEKEVEALFGRYCDGHNIYYGQRLKNYVTDVIQSEEIKKISHMIHLAGSEEDKAKLQEYIDNKPQSELNALIKLAVSNYQKNRSDFNRIKTNNFLAYFHKKIECKPYTKATENEIKATRIDFNGFFQIPSVEQLKHYNPYSLAYQSFCEPSRKNKTVHAPFEYDLQRCPAWQACKNTTILGLVELELRNAMGKQGIPPEIVKDMKVTDFGKILFNEYGSRPYNPIRGNRLRLGDVIPGLDSYHKVFFWKFNAIPTPESQKKFATSLLKRGVPQEYIDILIPSILKKGCPNPKVNRKKFKGTIPFFTLHHKWAIQYLGGKANNQKNYVGIAEFKTADDFSDNTPQHDIWHEADAIIRKSFGLLSNGDQHYETVPSGGEKDSDFIEYMVDTRYDNQNDGKYWTVSMGYKPEDNIRNEVRDFTIVQNEKEPIAKKGQGVDKGRCPAVAAR